MTINHVRVSYNINNTLDNFGNVLRGLGAVAYRNQLATQAASDATAKLANYLYPSDPNKAQDFVSNLKASKTAGDATLAGAGEGFLFSANSPYGTLGQQMERIGRANGEAKLVDKGNISQQLSPALGAIRNDPAAAAEWGAFTFARHSTSENYVFLPDALRAAENLPENTVVLEKSLVKDKNGNIKWDKSYLPDGFIPGSQDAGNNKTLKTYYTLSPKVAAVERLNAGILASRNVQRDNFYQAQGLPGKNYNPNVLYAPPIDKSKYPFFAYVKLRPGYAMGSDDTHILVAKDAGDLRQKISLLDPKYQAYTKDNITEFKKAQGTYDFNLAFNGGAVKTDMARAGLLTGLAPETRAENLINNFVQFHYNQSAKLINDFTELHNAKLFAQLNAMGERFRNTAASSFGRQDLPESQELNATNPYSSYTRTALGISSKDAYPFWGGSQEKLEAYANTAFNAVAQTFGALKRGIISPEDATKIAQNFGLGSPWGDTIDKLAQQRYYGGFTNQLPDKNILSKVVGTGNAILGSLRIRLDTFQQLVHAVTMPIMGSLEYYGASKDLQKLLSVTTPGAQPLQVPGFSKVLYNSIRNFFGPEKDKLDALYSGLGMPRDQIFAYRQMINELTVPPGTTTNAQWLQKLKNAGDFGEKISGTKFVNAFNHFIAADIGRQLGQAAGLQGQDLIDHIGTFTNRVLGNLTAGQRGAIFHGPVGQAIGLFQAYQYNLMQQVFRHIEEGNAKSLIIGSALQSSIFGLSSMPGFSHLNALIQTHYGNDSRDDLYSTAVKALGKSVADYLLYGSLSGLTGTALYSRGDLTPRNATIVSPNPMDLPIVQTGMKVYQNIAQMASNIASGGKVGPSVMLALEHNGLSRPLTGLMELMQGYSTDNRGNLISSVPNGTMGFSDLFSVANMARLGGARPLDEAIALDAMYRNNTAKQQDQLRLNQLGQALKTQLYDPNGTIDPATVKSFAAQYAASGGNINNFNRWVLDQANRSENSQVNKIFQTLGKDPSARTRMLEMGGVPLPQYQVSTQQ